MPVKLDVADPGTEVDRWDSNKSNFQGLASHVTYPQSATFTNPTKVSVPKNKVLEQKLKKLNA